MGYKIREAQTKKIPYTLVLGDKELESNTVNYRPYGKQEQVSASIDDFIHLILDHMKNKN